MPHQQVLAGDQSDLDGLTQSDPCSIRYCQPIALHDSSLLRTPVVQNMQFGWNNYPPYPWPYPLPPLPQNPAAFGHAHRAGDAARARVPQALRAVEQHAHGLHDVRLGSISGSAALRFAAAQRARHAPAGHAAHQRRARLERQSPLHKRGAPRARRRRHADAPPARFVERHASAPLRMETTCRALVELRVSIGQEALLSLHGGRAVGDSDSASGAQDSEWGLGGGATDANVLSGAFQRLAVRGAGAGDTGTLPMYVVHGAADWMVPAQGRIQKWLKSVLDRIHGAPARRGGAARVDRGA
ncbi:hypothetical protein GGX14DRAFT_660753 [Mycena pura]|uniref:Uncharacterized protein n=1 Tax=Mycena pura TaxID=153505 RepID=A0AAD6V589_9AGAR|nr:hypothetical protein GGX14DRAFT_660753 [Mycena pura]